MNSHVFFHVFVPGRSFLATASRTSLRAVVGLVLLWAWGCGIASVASAQEVGDRVVVTANFDTKILKKKVGKVYEGEIHTINAINGKWCALDDVEGWLPTQYVMNLKEAEKHFSQRIAKSDKDAAALAHRGLIRYENGDTINAIKDLNESKEARVSGGEEGQGLSMY